MYRLMQPSDRAAVVALWQKERGDTAEFINTAMDRFAGEQNVYVAEENGQIEAAALAVPVTLQGRPGNYLFGLCGQGSLILAGLVDTLCAQQKLRGAGFTVAAPTSPERAALLQDKGFQKAFALRCLPREVERNLWSQAEFDSVTAKKLCELRERFWPDTVMLTPEKMAVVLGDLYSRGATIVSSEQGYGIYFRVIYCPTSLTFSHLSMRCVPSGFGTGQTRLVLAPAPQATIVCFSSMISILYTPALPFAA